MTKEDRLINNLPKLSEKQLLHVYDVIKEMVNKADSFESFAASINADEVHECPHCKSSHFIKYGHNGKVQKYKCKECGKIFNIRTKTITSYTKKDWSVWQQFIDCFISQKSLRKTAEFCQISKDTAFYWRHKLSDMLSKLDDLVIQKGVVECDETFTTISFKGNHSLSKTFKMPREAHKRGNCCKKRGTSREKVCIPCSYDGNGNIISKIANLGRVSVKNLHYVFDGRIEKNSIICSDKMKAYIKFAEHEKLQLVQMKGGVSHDGLLHIQHINSYHSGLKTFLRRWRGVATKYLQGYLAYHNLLTKMSKSTDQEIKSYLKQIMFKTQLRDRIFDIKSKDPLPIMSRVSA